MPRDHRHPSPHGRRDAASADPVLSCIQPTGDVHLGNYLGALRNWVAGQHDVRRVPRHRRPARPDGHRDARRRRRHAPCELAAMLFAIGLDPDVATVFVQSHVPEHTQLAWVMECTVSYGELQRMTQFKEKSAKREGHFISAGLFTYPALQAADILLYDTERGAGRRRPAPARRDHPRHRDPLQPPLRRHVRGPGGRDAGGRRPGDGPAGPDVEDVEVRRVRGRLRVPDRRARGDHEEVQAGGHRLRDGSEPFGSTGQPSRA